MIVHNDPLLSIYFGDAKNALNEESIEQASKNLSKLPEKYFSSHDLKKSINLDFIFLLNQVHGNKGVVIKPEDISFNEKNRFEGDFLITQLERVGLGVYTADCLPIVFYDSYNSVVGICHAGWKGSFKLVALTTIAKMKDQFGTKLDHLRVFFGPSAKVCCYEVSEDFKENIDQKVRYEVLIKKNNKTFFDLPKFNKLLLENFGVRSESFHLTYNLCTICDVSFCSNRREGENSKRQLTVVALK